MSDLRWWVEKMRGLRAYVVGDAIIDQYEFGRCARLSPEAPVPVFIPEHSETRQGGAANVAANLTALGLEVETTFAAVAHRSKKTRFMVGGHQLLRVDEDVMASVEEPVSIIEAKLARAQVLVLSDYAKGAFTQGTGGARWLIEEARKERIPVIVDPKGVMWEEYGACTVICPNAAEWIRHCEIALPRPVFRAVFVKEGARGITILENGQAPRQYPARARHVFDVVGAGDSVVAAVAATLATGGDLDAAAQIANAAAGVVVEEIGTSVCTAAQLLERLA